MTKDSSNTASNTQQAIENYLDALLQDVTGEVTGESVEAETPSPQRAVAEPVATPQRTQVQEPLNIKMPELTVAEETATEVPETATKAEEDVPEAESQVQVKDTVVEAAPQTQVTETVETPPAEAKPAEPVVAEEIQVQPQTQAGWSGWTDGRPDWAQERFECLLFKVSGLTLAVPLKELGGIHKVEHKPTPLFGQPDWFLGLVRSSQHNVHLVDTAKWVMPEHYKEELREGFKYAIRIEGGEWGLACDEVAEAISLDPDEVRWRSKGGKRPWLAGTVIKHMCALIDVSAFARLLDEADQRRRKVEPED